MLVRHNQTKTTATHITRVTTKLLGYKLQHLLSGVLRVFQDMTQPSCHRLSTNRLSRVASQFMPPLEGGIGVTCHIARDISICQKRCITQQVPRPTLALLRKRGSEVIFWFKLDLSSVCLQTMYTEKSLWARKTSKHDFQQTISSPMSPSGCQ